MNEEKDRFGDLIRLLEQAREDVYFAEKDRELLDKLKRRVECAQSAQAENPELKCPRCGVHLDNAILVDFPVSRCAACDGIWLEGAVLTQFMNMVKPFSASGKSASASRDSLRNVWPAGLGGMGKSLGGG